MVGSQKGLNAHTVNGRVQRAKQPFVMVLLPQLCHNLSWKVLQSLLMKSLVAMSMLKRRETGCAGREQNERPHFHGVKERLESERTKEQFQEELERMRCAVSVINGHRYKGKNGQGVQDNPRHHANTLISAVNNSVRLTGGNRIGPWDKGTLF